MSTFARYSRKISMIQFSKICVALMLVACAAPALAQDQEKPDKIVLEQKIGSVMTSTGGDYESANAGKLLIRDESMMLTDGAKATVVYYYDDGKRKCTEVYKGPNTFVIDDNCKVAGYLAGNGHTGVALIAGAALIGAALLGNNNNNIVPPPPPPPVSGSSR